MFDGDRHPDTNQFTVHRLSLIAVLQALLPSRCIIPTEKILFTYHVLLFQWYTFQARLMQGCFYKEPG